MTPFTPTHKSASTGQPWQLLGDDQGYSTFMDAKGCTYRLPTSRAHLQFFPLESVSADASRERFDELMSRPDWSWVTQDQRGVLWELWQEAQLCR